VYVHDVTCYNRCDEAFVDFSNRIFRLDHRSYYNKQDMDILFEYHTVANVGFLKKRQTTHGLIEIDMSKAYTSAFMAIDRVPVFNEFDIFKPYPEGQKSRTSTCTLSLAPSPTNSSLTKRATCVMELS
jgi:hypothetical protein